MRIDMKTLLWGILILVGASDIVAFSLHSSLNSTAVVNGTIMLIGNASEAGASTTKQPGGPDVLPTAWSPEETSNFTRPLNPVLSPEETSNFTGPPNSVLSPEKTSNFTGPPNPVLSPEETSNFTGPPNPALSPEEIGNFTVPPNPVLSPEEIGNFTGSPNPVLSPEETSNFTERSNDSLHSGVTNAPSQLGNPTESILSTKLPTSTWNLTALATLPTQSGSSIPTTPSAPSSPSTSIPFESSTKSQTLTSRVPTSSSLSTSPAGAVNPTSTKGAPAPAPVEPCGTVATKEMSNIPPEVKSCNTYDMVKYCLIAIACLAALAIVFIISTVALCVKLSQRTYKFKKCRDETEMMCISSILPEMKIGARRQQSHVSNGVLVIHTAGNSDDDDDDDNLTLSSFLPENDRLVGTLGV